MVKRSNEPAAHYDRVTNAWKHLIGEDFHVGYFRHPGFGLPEAAAALTHFMARIASPEAGMDVLDVGCGTGNPAAYIASHFGCRVVGISTSKACVQAATRIAKSRRLSHHLSFRVADALDTRFDAESFDRIWVMETSHLIPQKDLLLQECVRMLRPMGKIVLCDYFSRRELSLSEAFELRRDIMTLQEVFGRTSMRHVDFYQNTLEGLGVSTAVYDISDYVLPTFGFWQDNAQRHRQIAEEILGPDEVTKFVRGCEIMTRLFRQGIWGYGVIAATSPTYNQLRYSFSSRQNGITKPSQARPTQTAQPTPRFP